ncbi:hypothetical protein AAA799D07_00497 [Marine Group I thaumarchaeote SCGC AAA799-D07]|nr:hypothetical protein AAA799D07_00497 [Marine Group I thaumarchaeote SCGC AAA799-D07]
MQKYDIAIIGGGILGTTISYWLSTLYDLKICVIEKEHDIALQRISLGQHSFLMTCGKYWLTKTIFLGFKGEQLKLH